jgi:predicted dehydrogenase
MTKENVHKALVQYRIGDMYSPKIDQTEALALAAREFITSIKENRLPLTNAYDGLEVVRILEAANKSIKNKGTLVEIFNPYFKTNGKSSKIKQAVGF